VVPTYHLVSHVEHHNLYLLCKPVPIISLCMVVIFGGKFFSGFSRVGCSKNFYINCVY